MQTTLASPTPPTVSVLRTAEQRILTALHFALWSDKAARKTPLQVSIELLWQHPAIREELVQLLAFLEDRASIVPTPLAEVLGWQAPVPLSVHSAYRLDDILSAFDLMTPEKPHRIREGVKYDEATQSDLFFVTLNKAEKHYSPTTRYRDFAISPQPLRYSLGGRAASTSVSHRTATGCQKAPTRFFPSGRLTPVFPPIAASTWARSVVATWTRGTPRW